MAISTTTNALNYMKLSNPSPIVALHNQTGSIMRFVAMETKKKRSGMVCNCAKATFGPSKGGAGLLERPNFDQSQFDPTPQAEQGGDMGRVTDKRGPASGDSYKVLLIDDTCHTEKLVVNVLPKVVPFVTADDARRLFHESRQNGFSVVIVAIKQFFPVKTPYINRFPLWDSRNGLTS